MDSLTPKDLSSVRLDYCASQFVVDGALINLLGGGSAKSLLRREMANEIMVMTPSLVDF